MAEPQPPQVHEGAIDQEDEPSILPASGDARKAAAALSSLDARGEDDSVKKSQADQEALGKAMSRLELVEKPPVQSKGKEPEGEKKKIVKVDQADVALLVSRQESETTIGSELPPETNGQQVEELELSRAKATELLKGHDGDAVKAMTAFVRAHIVPAAA